MSDPGFVEDATWSNLKQAVDALNDVVERVRPGQWDNPSPWPGWSVRALVVHLIDGNEQTAARWEDLTSDPAPSGLQDGALRLEAERRQHPAAAFRASGERLLATARASSDNRNDQNALARRFFDLIVHGWDIAVATGQPPDFAPRLQELALTHAHQLLDGKDRTETPFGPPLAIAEDAPAGDRLAAFLGCGRPVSTGADRP